MGRWLGASGVAFVAVMAAGTAMAAPHCARPAEETAIRVAAIQQELMVAALTCNDVSRYNAFQTGYARELRRSDRELAHMFRRLFGSSGMRRYHAFKTRLANASSMRSIRDNAGYCQEAGQLFAAALGTGKSSLTTFASSVEVHADSPVDSCHVRSARLQEIPAIVPRPNPLRVAALAPAPAASMAPAAHQVRASLPAADKDKKSSGIVN